MLRILEFPDVMADACLRDSEGRFMFLSIYGRDNAVLQFIAAMELPQDQQGIIRFHLVDEDGTEHPADVGGTNRLAKHSGHMPKQTIFGAVNHMWIFDKGMSKPDMANRIAWVLHTNSAVDAELGTLDDRVWAMVKRLSPVPILDAWRAQILEWGWSTGALRRLDDPKYPPIGNVAGARVSLNQTFLAHVSELVRSGALTLASVQQGGR